MIHNKFWQAFFALAPMGSIFITLMGYVIFMLSILGHIKELENAESDAPLAFFAGLGIFLLFVFLVLLLSLGSLVFYIVHAAQNPNLRQNNLLLIWILLFVFASGLGQLIYWIVEILNKKEVP